jgi:hypothetical protein
LNKQTNKQTRAYLAILKYCVVVDLRSTHDESIILLGVNQLILSAPVALNRMKAFSTPFLYMETLT